MKLCIAALILCLSMVFADRLDEKTFLIQLQTEARPKFLALNAVIYIRVGAVYTSAAFDALAPYHETAVGMYSSIPRRAESERTTRNKNIAITYAYLRVLNELVPTQKQFWNSQLQAVGLDPNDFSTDLSTPVGIGNAAAQGVLAVRLNDGMNQAGNASGVSYNRDRYDDSTVFVYRPRNSPFTITQPNLWQPTLDTSPSFGIYTCQVHLTPQYSQVRPFSLFDVTTHQSPEPVKSRIETNRAGYVEQVQEILDASYALNDFDKMSAEFFNEKPNSVGKSLDTISQVRDLSLDEYVLLSTAVKIAMHDAGILAWQEKLRYDTIRPVSAIKYLYSNETVRAWGGPGVGPVDDMRGNEWMPYIRTPPHSDYPSGSACFCSAFAQVLRRHFGSDSFDYSVTHLKGASKVEPGLTPSADLTITYETLTDFVDSCARARFLGGIHFHAACDEGKRLCKPVGDYAYDFVLALYNGGTRGGCRAHDL